MTRNDLLINIMNAPILGCIRYLKRGLTMTDIIEKTTHDKLDDALYVFEKKGYKCIEYSENIFNPPNIRMPQYVADRRIYYELFIDKNNPDYCWCVFRTCELGSFVMDVLTIVGLEAHLSGQLSFCATILVVL